MLVNSRRIKNVTRWQDRRVGLPVAAAVAHLWAAVGSLPLGLHHLRNLRAGQEGARHNGYTGHRGYHPLLAVAAGTCDVLMSRLREGRANTARGAGRFLRETVGRYAMLVPVGDSRWGRQRLLHPCRGVRLTQAGCPLLHHHPPARPPEGVD